MHLYLFSNKVSFYSEKLLAPHPNRNLNDHPLSVVIDCLFNVFALPSILDVVPLSAT